MDDTRRGTWVTRFTILCEPGFPVPPGFPQAGPPHFFLSPLHPGQGPSTGGYSSRFVPWQGRLRSSENGMNPAVQVRGLRGEEHLADQRRGGLGREVLLGLSGVAAVRHGRGSARMAYSSSSTASIWKGSPSRRTMKRLQPTTSSVSGTLTPTASRVGRDLPGNSQGRQSSSR